MNKYYKKNRSRISNKKRIFLLSLTIVLIIIASLIYLERKNYIDLPLISSDNTSKVEQGQKDDTINYNPPTEQEIQETEEFKQEQKDDPVVPPPSSGENKISVKPIISSWGKSPDSNNVEASGYVPSILEEGGTCTLIMELGTAKVSKSRTAVLNAQNTSCGFIIIPGTELSSGNWKLTLSYSSITAEGFSDPVYQEIQ